MSDLADLKDRLAARTDATGKPRKGYKASVMALRHEIARLERQCTPSSSTPTVPDTSSAT